MDQNQNAEGQPFTKRIIKQEKISQLLFQFELVEI